MKTKVRVGRLYRYEPVGLDRWSSGYRPNIAEGTLVRAIKPPYGCGSKVTVNCGHCYVESLEGRFLGMVLVGSLEPVVGKLREVEVNGAKYLAVVAEESK
jgi:hypothetical protein